MLNKVELLGNLTADPQMYETADGTKIAKFSVATSEYYTDKKGEKQQLTEFHNCSAFGKLAEIVENYTSKGKKVFISGKLKTVKKETDDGTRYYTGIVAQEIILLSPKESDEEPKKKAPKQEEEIQIEDIPFF